MSRFGAQAVRHGFVGWIAVAAVTLTLHRVEASAQGMSSDCLIEPHAVSELETREIGALEEVLVDRGDLVRAGQPVARLESGSEEIAVELMRARAQMDDELAEARVRADYAARRLERTSRLMEQSTVSDHEHDQAATEAMEAKLQLGQALQRQKIAKLELRRAEEQLQRRTLRSPIDGLVVKRLLQVGESVEDRPIMEIAASDPLNVEIIKPVSEFGTVRVGQIARVVPQYPGASPVAARVTVVDGLIDAASGTFGVRLELPNPGHEIPGGVRCEVFFEADDVATNLTPPPDSPTRSEGGMN
jgi:RND family efflux transporter MFP subunit